MRVRPLSGRSVVTDAPFPETAAEPVVRALGLSKRFAEGPPVLDGVELTIRGGERVALVGANGAGKSTLLRCLVGLLPLTGGSVEILDQHFAGRPDRAQRRALRRRLGFVFQFHGLVGRTSALSNVVNGALGQGIGWRAWYQGLAPQALRREALAALDSVGLAERAAARADTLSGGQSQRVAIARALVHRPDLLIADEPAASLDPVAGAEIMTLFRGLTESRGVTLIFTTHDLTHALDYADRVVALARGRVVLDAPVAGIDRDALERIYHD